MPIFSRVTILAALWSMASLSAAAQEKSGKDEKRECGYTSEQLKRIVKSLPNRDPKEVDRKTDEHFKKNHPDGPCHCTCSHDEKSKPPKVSDGGEAEAKKPCGLDRDGYKKSHKKKGQDEKDCDREADDHFGKVHPGEKACHCSCEHTFRQKGNNGLGNGIDPQPPGNPPVNDGPGTSPGNPGNKKHGAQVGPGNSGKGGKHQEPGGPPAGKGKPDKGGSDDDDKGKGKPKS